MIILDSYRYGGKNRGEEVFLNLMVKSHSFSGPVSLGCDLQKFLICIFFFPHLDQTGKAKGHWNWVIVFSLTWNKALVRYFPLENRSFLWKVHWGYFQMFIFPYPCQRYGVNEMIFLSFSSWEPGGVPVGETYGVWLLLKRETLRSLPHSS